jgi:hypothetical protein
MRGAVLLLPQYDFMAWCSIKTTGRTLLLLHQLVIMVFSVSLDTAKTLSVLPQFYGNTISQRFKVKTKHSGKNFGAYFF